MDQNKDVKSLAAIDEFAKYWQYYQYCRGQAFANECREAAKVFFTELPNVVDIINSRPLELREATQLSGSLKTLMEWQTHPNDSHVLNEDQITIQTAKVGVLFSFLRSTIYSRFGLGPSNLGQTALDNLKLEEHLKWRGHLPKLSGDFDPDNLMAKAETRESIVVVGDIRRSQDLMTYADNPIGFTAEINDFLSNTRRLLDNHGAIFDKFTGDGFVAYFNDEVGLYHKANRDDSFVDFIREYTPLMDGHFQRWKRNLRKLPDEPLGLAIGADLGKISFRVPDCHFVAVGQAIVWATRMASAARAGETVVNNLLYENLRTRNDIVFEPRTGKTKSGEGFLAWALLPKSKN